MSDFYDQQFLKQFFPDKPLMSTKMDQQMYKDTLKDNVAEYETYRANESMMDEAQSKPLLTTVDKNLKTLAAIGKPRMSDVPPVALFALGAAMSDGKDKYGRFNWRETGATSSVFYDAMMRHLAAWYSGEDYAPDSKVHHLGHIMASCAILLDSTAINILNDDRNQENNPLIDKIWLK
jgi:hypothetical protein